MKNEKDINAKTPTISKMETVQASPETPKAIVPEMTDEEIEKLETKFLHTFYETMPKKKYDRNIEAGNKLIEMYRQAINKPAVTPDKEVSRPIYIDREEAIRTIEGKCHNSIAAEAAIDTLIRDGHITTQEQRREDKPLTGWISVKDGLPIFNEKVLVYTFADELFIAHRASGIMATGEWYESFRNLQIRSSITHWQPLPEKP